MSKLIYGDRCQKKQITSGERLTEKRHEAVFWVVKVFYILIGMWVTRVFAFIKIDYIYAPCITVYVNHTSTKNNI